MKLSVCGECEATDRMVLRWSSAALETLEMRLMKRFLVQKQSLTLDWRTLDFCRSLNSFAAVELLVLHGEWRVNERNVKMKSSHWRSLTPRWSWLFPHQADSFINCAGMFTQETQTCTPWQGHNSTCRQEIDTNRHQQTPTDTNRHQQTPIDTNRCMRGS